MTFVSESPEIAVDTLRTQQTMLETLLSQLAQTTDAFSMCERRLFELEHRLIGSANELKHGEPDSPEPIAALQRIDEQMARLQRVHTDMCAVIERLERLKGPNRE